MKICFIENGFIRDNPGLGVAAFRLAEIGEIVPLGTSSPVDKDGYTWIQLETGHWTASQNVFYLPDVLDDFLKSLIFILKWEGGYVNDVRDPGGETKFGISKRSFPNLDIAMLTVDQAAEIYRRSYWVVGGCDKMAWPINLIHFNFGVNAGLGAAAAVWDRSNKTADDYLIKQEEYYRSLHLFSIYGRGWLNRLASLKEYIKEF